MLCTTSFSDEYGCNIVSLGDSSARIFSNLYFIGVL